MTPLRLLAFLCLLFPSILPAQLSFDLFYGPSSSSRFPDQVLSDGKGNWYMVEQQFSYTPFQARMIHTGNGGIQWNFRVTTPNRRYFVGLNGLVYGVQGPSIYQSADQGQSWALLTDASPGDSYSQLSAGAGGILNLTNQQGIYRSADGGKTWEKRLDCSNLGWGARHLYNWPELGGLWITVKRGKYFELWHSADQGQNWALSYSTTHDLSFNYNALIPGPEDNTLYLNLGGDYNRVARSVDGGLSWQESVVKPFSPARVTTMASLPTGSVVARMNDKRWYRSTDQGLNWSEYTPNWHPGLVELNRLPDGPLLAAGTVALHRWDTDTNQFAYAGGELEGFSDFAFAGPDKFIGLYSGSAQVVITPNGREYQPFAHPQFYPSRIRTDKHGNVFYLSSAVLYGPVLDSLFVADVSASGGLRDFEVGSDGTLFLLAEYFLYYSKDGGITWVRGDSVPVYHHFDELAVSAAGPVYVSDHNRLWRSFDGGATMEVVGDECCFNFLTAGNDGAAYFKWGDNPCTIGSISPASAHWVVLGFCPFPVQGGYQLTNIVPLAPGEMWAGGEWDSLPAVFYSKDNGVHWDHYLVETGWQGEAYVYPGPDGHLYVRASEHGAPYRHAIYRSMTRVWDPGSVNTGEAAPVAMRLYPNPAGDYLLAEIPEAKPGWQLEVYDMLGRRLSAQRVVQEQNVYQVPLSLPSGVYRLAVCAADGHLRGAATFMKQ